MMYCRRCGRDSTSRPRTIVAHFHNWLLEGWFCIPCANALIDEAALDIALPVNGDDR